ncbi:hypothetical protein [Corynebacterium aquilae]|uniref:hypothetical protein n=1 Tax=Corynebacterium aquilae TaxID=203263 RepID=UPI0012EDEE1C|nr:hypothetical protein [Corynebacterium aquilae]
MSNPPRPTSFAPGFFMGLLSLIIVAAAIATKVMWPLLIIPAVAIALFVFKLGPRNWYAPQAPGDHLDR